MSAPAWCEYVCDECALQSPGMWSSNGRVPLQALRNDAKRAGFQIEGDSVLCRNCVKSQPVKQGDTK